MQQRDAVISRPGYNASKPITVVSSLVFPCLIVCTFGEVTERVRLCPVSQR